MSLETPSKIRTLQRKLYRKAKDEPEYRFYLLCDKVYREDILAHAYELAKANRGAPGVDGQTFEGIEAQGLKKWLKELGNELRAKRYKPQPVRRVMIPKDVLQRLKKRKRGDSNDGVRLPVQAARPNARSMNRFCARTSRFFFLSPFPATIFPQNRPVRM
jgi:hypothetical protein